MNIIRCENSRTFTKGFILREEHLQSIENIINKYFVDEKITYKITKNNFFSYISSDINDILKEDNSKTDYITKLEISINTSEIVNMILIFDKGEKTVLNFSCNNREKFKLFYSDLEDYLNQEVCVVGSFDLQAFLVNTTSWGIIALIGDLLYNKLITITKFKESDLKNVIQSSDIIEKLNYIISKTEYKLIDSWFYLFTIIIAIINVIGVVKHKLTFTDYFLFGKEIKIYEHKIALRNNIIWTIIIGLVVSVLGGIIVTTMPFASLF